MKSQWPMVEQIGRTRCDAHAVLSTRRNVRRELLPDLAAAWDGGEGETSANERLFAEIGFAANLSGSTARPTAALDAPPVKSFAASSARPLPAIPARKRATLRKPMGKRPRSRLGTLWLAGCLLVASFFGYQAARDATADLPTPPITPVSRQTAAPQLVERPIEEIRVGERVHVEAGYGDADYSLGAEVDPAIWRKLTLHVDEPGGTYCDVELLRPVAWLQQHAVEIGGTLDLSLHELGVEGLVYVRDVAPCPPVRDGPGRVVTGTFHHSAAEVLDLHIEGTKPIGTTANHPFWSEDRQAFIRADRLYPGERVRTLDGTPRVTSIIPRASPQPVYNLEIQVDHVYHVSASGVLVHNVKPKAKIAPRSSTALVPKGATPLGNWGEARLKHLLDGKGAKMRFSTSHGRREIDRLVDGIAHESKAGVNVGLTNRIRTQVLKDKELIDTGAIEGARWHFWQGADQGLLEFLTENGIKHTVH